MPISFNLFSPQMLNAVNRKSTLILLIICLTLVGFHYLVFDFMIPKTAPLAIPYKWRMVPLRQNKEIVRGYFGAPDPDHSSLARDEWFGGTKDKTYILKISYIYDTIASSYSIRYRYKKWFGSREYLIDTGAIR
jgi:hypothetical protein